MTGVHEARENLGARLRELRRDAGLDGRKLAALAGWHPAKVSKIEHGKQTPSEDDIRTWCAHTRAHLHVPDLIASVRNINAAYLEWKRILATGLERRQRQAVEIEVASRLIRGYEPELITGLLQTEAYTRALLTTCISFSELLDDLDATVAVRMDRLRVLHEGVHRFHFLLSEKSLYTAVGSDQVMAGQLHHLLDLLNNTRLVVGILRIGAGFRCPTNNFLMYDQRLVQVETVTAELSITQPREIALYDKTFQALTQQAVYGASARALIVAELDRLRRLLESDGDDV